MAFTNSRVHETKDKLSLYIPCDCGDNSDNIVFTYWKDYEPGDFVIMGVSLKSDDSWRGRLGAAWRALWNTSYDDSALISVETAKELSSWLSQCVLDYESKPCKS